MSIGSSIMTLHNTYANKFKYGYDEIQAVTLLDNIQLLKLLCHFEILTQQSMEKS